MTSCSGPPMSPSVHDQPTIDAGDAQHGAQATSDQVAVQSPRRGSASGHSLRQDADSPPWPTSLARTERPDPTGRNRKGRDFGLP
jgi:hypothetical protein